MEAFWISDPSCCPIEEVLSKSEMCWALRGAGNITVRELAGWLLLLIKKSACKYPQTTATSPPAARELLVLLQPSERKTKHVVGGKERRRWEQGVAVIYQQEVKVMPGQRA